MMQMERQDLVGYADLVSSIANITALFCPTPRSYVSVQYP